MRRRTASTELRIFARCLWDLYRTRHVENDPSMPEPTGQLIAGWFAARYYVPRGVYHGRRNWRGRWTWSELELALPERGR